MYYTLNLSNCNNVNRILKVEDSSEYIRRFYNFRIIGKEAKSKRKVERKFQPFTFNETCLTYLCT